MSRYDVVKAWETVHKEPLPPHLANMYKAIMAATDMAFADGYATACRIHRFDEREDTELSK